MAIASSPPAAPGRGARWRDPADRPAPFGLALISAAILHAAIILGVSFEPENPGRLPPDRTLEIMVVRYPEPKKEPVEPDFLAQTSQQGGGTEAERVRPTTEVAPTPLPEPLPTPEPLVAVPAPPEPPAVEPPPVEPPPPPLPEPPPALEPEPAPQPPPPEPPVVTAPVPDAASEPTVPPKPEKPKPEKAAPKKPVQPKPEPTPKKEPKKEVTAADLLASTNAEIERLTAELDRKTEAYAKRPRRAFVSASTKEYRYAAYMENWRQKVERIGNLNYPAEAKKLKLYGSLILDVVLNPQGEVLEIEVRRSSGQKLLDDAAINIVRLAAPYAPFPPDIKREVDLLHITRTWQFRNNNQLFAQ